ncbi:MAG: LytTR family DNA-binding domain-containing protein [Burkholderiaceae bacterium]|nr:LytTR family DNA-binding domain-containing protein [Burkholderiaceae bacterium]
MTNAADPLRVLIVDDEELARLRMRALIDECAEPRARVVGEAANAAQALVWLQRHGQGPTAPGSERACDLVLLDIQMPGRDGTQLAEELRTLPLPPAIVFVTAHAGHALKAFDLDAVDYLTKPVRRERLQLALQRVSARLGQPITVPGDLSVQPEPVLVVSERGRVVRVPVGEVLYLKSELKYVTLRTANHTYVLDDALSDLEQRLGDRFLRVHRNALVARSVIIALERRTMIDAEGEAHDESSSPGECWAVRVAPVDEWLAVSRRQASAVREALAASGL